MKKLILVLLKLTTIFSLANAQVIDGMPLDSTTFRFTDTSFSHLFIGDTSTAPLWHIGRTFKPSFTSDTNGVVALMTDTLYNYPDSVDKSFVMRMPMGMNIIIDIWHRYEFDSFQSGGAVEISGDTGRTWFNVVGACNYALGPGILTENFYSDTTVLWNGVSAFSGQSAGRLSRFQLFWGLPLKTTIPVDCPISPDVLLVRFRFMSDTTADTLAGWVIDSVRAEYDWYAEGAVGSIAGVSIISPFPNPSKDGKFLFPEIIEAEKYTLSIRDQLGRVILTRPYTRDVDLAPLPPNLYFFTVSDGRTRYSGKIVTGP
ncbi:MAG: T9SS type A sorting domain-containing protein [Taibaiella sp.]|nr:T9SS type A sorting domain-containing protein [Taibaiella sp.]